MGETEDEDLAAEKKSISITHAIFTVIHFLMADLIFYGCIIPLLGTYVGGYFAYKLNLGFKGELVFIVLLTFLMMCGTFHFLAEENYWKHLFAFDQFYCNLLQVRDFLNGCLMVLCMFGIVSTLKAMIKQDEGIKPLHVSEGVIYVFQKIMCQYLRVDESFILNLGIGIDAPPTGGTVNGRSPGKKFENGTAFVLYFAILTGCVAKLIYFNTLFTYVRAMSIFVGMKPNFGEDDDGSDSSMSVFSKNKKRLQVQCRMETDFATSVRRSTFEENTSYYKMK